MRNLKGIALLAIVCLCGINLYAQDQSNVIKLNVIGPIFGQYQVAYEKAIAPKLSLQLSAGYLAGKSEGNSSLNGDSYDYENQRSGFILIPEVRYYPFNNAPKGFFLGGFGRFRQATNDLTDSSNGTEGIAQNLSRERIVTTIGGGGVLGFQWISKGGFSFDIFAGTGYKSRSTETTYDLDTLNEKATNPDEYDSLGDELFNQKYLDFKLDDKEGWGLRFGFHFGYAF
ncbi:MAG: DUF3575 domain-containing protein [Chitinophagales bacterium]|nr:DUF3575 domain-containing protein [Chitinophagales bacterium]